MGSPKIQSRQELIDHYADQPEYHNAAINSGDHNWWETRERIRLDDGTYSDLPDSVLEYLRYLGQNIPAVHFCHVSMAFPGMVAYTPSADYGKQDRQIRTKFGKYLRNNSGLTLTEPQIAEVSAMLRSCMAPADLLFARTEEEIAMVYDKGPRSCMGGEGRVYDHDIAPVRVYASPDCGIAYTVRDDRIVSRTVVRFDRMEYLRTYGDEIALEAALKDAGYTQGSTLEGCRLKMVEHNGEYVMAYLDGDDQSVSHYTDQDGKQWWIVDSHGLSVP
jgi:ketosteroid isomerase-like protein